METQTGLGRMSLEQALSGKRIPRAIRRSQALLDVEHLGFDGRTYDGQLVVHRAFEKDVATIFATLYKWQFPINKIVPIAAYGWNDTLSMEDNNSLSFDHRKIEGINRLSKHASGPIDEPICAIDLNPRQNPHIKNGIITPQNGTYNPKEPGTLVNGGREVKLFESFGFSWGGKWRFPTGKPKETLKDYMHFENP